MSIDASTAAHVAHGTDFTDPDTMVAGVPLPEFAYLRQNKPLFWNPQTAGGLELRRRRLLAGHPPRGREGHLRRPRGLVERRRTPPS